MTRKKRSPTKFFRLIPRVLIAALTVLILAEGLVALLHPKRRWLEGIRTQAYYTAQPWTETYIADSDQVGRDSREFYPYLLWRRPPFQSATVNIDAGGRRVVPGAQCGAGAFRIFMFGSSVLWGVGAPDGLTIPALVQKELSASAKTSVCVVNFAETGWTSTQSVTALLLELQRGERPQAVVIAQGATDLLAALENRNAYLHFAYFRIAAHLAPTARFQFLLKLFFPRLSEALGVSFERRAWSDFEPMNDDAIYPAVARVYGENLRAARALSKEYRFALRAFWLPDPLYGGKPLTPDEVRFREQELARRALGVERYEDMLRAITREAPELVLLGDTLDTIREQVFIDPLHVNPIGNALIARRISLPLRRLLRDQLIE